MTLQQSAQLVVNHIISLKDFTWHPCPFPYKHMGASIVDASLQAGIDYDKVVRRRVECLRMDYPKHITTSAFADLVQRHPLEKLIQWTHGEKLRRIRAALELFKNEKVETEDKLFTWLKVPANQKKLFECRGVGSKTFDYYMLLSGHSTVAIDRHLLDFLKNSGCGTVPYKAAHRILIKAALILKIKAKDLDHSIWKYMSKKARLKTKTTSCVCPNSSNSGNPRSICVKLTTSGCYEKVTVDCTATRNIGIIEKNGHLSIKVILRNMLNKAGAASPSTGVFTATTGSTHGVGGVGYVSYYKFRSPADAKHYLSRWFGVVTC